MNARFTSFAAWIAALILPILEIRAEGTQPQPVGPFLNGVFPSTAPGPTGSWELQDIFPNLTLVDPVRLVKDPLGSEYVYIVCRNGEIWKVPFRSDATDAEKVRFFDQRFYTWNFWDAGLLGFVFHPRYGIPGDPNRGTVFAFYQYLPQVAPMIQLPPWNPFTRSYMVLSRFTVPDGSETVDMSSEEELIQQFDRHNWHNGGQMFFGPEGFLYLVVGDEGDENDSFDVCQKIDDRLFSGILRIDVDRDPTRSHPIRRQPRNTGVTPVGWEQSFTEGYFIPNDNPWQDTGGGILEEFWTIGLRSPHSMHYDAVTGEIWIAEVGQESREEITIATKGGNHQWPYKEGTIDGIVPKPTDLIGIERPPVFDYGRSMGGCVIGGIVYRGNDHASELEGKYLFGDHNTGAVYSLERQPDGPPLVEYITRVPRASHLVGLSGICEGPDGEAYLMELGGIDKPTGKVFKLVRDGQPVPEPPALLSQTGAFSDLATLTPAPGLIPYGVNSPLWTDGAVKRRWIAIPNDGTHDSPDEQVVFSADGAWTFPPGTVLVKHFALPVDETDPSVIRPIETRFFVHGSDGKYYGVTYRWNEEGTDATLLGTGEEVTVDIALEGGGTRQQTWTIPGRADCLTCHNGNAGDVLGLRAHQLNGAFHYSDAGITANQLENWAAMGIFGDSFAGHSSGTLPRSVAIDDSHASLDQRARSYLDANCSHCHRPGGVSAQFDARFTTPLALQNIVGGELIQSGAGQGMKVVEPGDLAKSWLHGRVSVVGANQMPPLGKNVVDQAAVELLSDWILSMEPASFEYSGGDQPPVAVDDSVLAGHGGETLIDVLANDTDTNAPPGFHGLSIVTPPQHGTVRILGNARRLAYVHDGSATWSDSFTYALTDPQGLISQPAQVAVSVPFDYTAWRNLTPGAGHSPYANQDGDAYSDLLEYALGGSPLTGTAPSSGGVELDLEGGFEFVVRHPQGISGVEYVAETSADLVNWSPVDPSSVESDGWIETLRFPGLDMRPGLSADAGFVRLRVVVEGVGESVTSSLGWLSGEFGPGAHPVGNPFRNPPYFGSLVTGVEDGKLKVNGDPGLPGDFRGYVEVVEGPHAGHRFDIDVAGTGDGRIALADAPWNTLSPVPDLTGSRIVGCPHHHLGGSFPEALLVGSTNPTKSDRIHILDGGVSGPWEFSLHHLVDVPGKGIRGWRNFIGGSDSGGTILPPGDGVIFHRPTDAAPVRLTVSGEVRDNSFLRPLAAGRNLIAPPFPLEMTPRQIGLLDGTFAVGDRIRVLGDGGWKDVVMAAGGDDPDWWSDGSPGVDVGDLPLFHPRRAFFLIPSNAHGGHPVSPPWNP